MDLKKKIYYKINQLLIGNPVYFGTNNHSVRDEWLKKTIEKIPTGGRILDAGAGEQPYKEFCKHLNYVSQDFAAYNPNDLSQGLQMKEWDYGKIDIECDITAIPEPDNSFDAILCTEVLEHVPEPIKVIKEFSRLLKSKGYLIITAPFCSLTHFAPYHFYSGFNHFFFEKFLPENDLYIVEIKSNGNYFKYLAQEIHRIPQMAQKYANENINSRGKRNLQKNIKILERISDKDKNSSELLNFGFHILARKQ